jgi:hypothetical protein
MCDERRNEDDAVAVTRNGKCLLYKKERGAVWPAYEPPPERRDTTLPPQPATGIANLGDYGVGFGLAADVMNRSCAPP